MIHGSISVIIVLIQVIIVVVSVFIFYRLFRTQRIRSSKSHLESTFDSIDDPLAIINENHIILRANKSYAALVGRSFQELIGQKCHMVLRGRPTPCTDCLLKVVLSTGLRQYVQSSTHPIDPNAKTISFTFYPFTEKSGLTTTIVEHIRDTTEVELLKENLEKQNRVLSETTKILKLAQKEIDEELQMARLVQQSTLPEKIPDFSGLNMAVTYHPIEAVGGDVYDFIPFGNDKLGIFIGDASGHGMPAALVGTISKMSLYNHTKTEMPTNDLILHVNNDLIGNVRTGHYLTCFWGIFDKQDNTLTYSRAGHPMPIVIRKNGDIVQLEAVGMFAGILDKPAFEQRKFHFNKGDRCYFFTDGIFEVVDPANEQFTVLGFKKFVSILSSINQLPFDQLIPEIRNRLSGFTYDDDYTLIAFEITEDHRQDLSKTFPGFEPNEPIAFIRFSSANETDELFATLFDSLQHSKFSEGVLLKIKLSLSELVANAIIHGNREDPDKFITIGYAISNTEFKACIVDEGEGFDINDVADPANMTHPPSEGGRGLFLVKKYTAMLRQNVKGNGIYFSINKQ
jgi:sigma-B regulation protein RsbU (phosphoserine phosphatase)